jgi:hypothetical protein
VNSAGLLTFPAYQSNIRTNVRTRFWLRGFDDQLSDVAGKPQALALAH